MLEKEAEVIETIYYGFFMGLCATLAMDLWAVIQHRIWNFPLPNWAMPGRWFAYLSHGRFFHQDIGQTKEIPNELALGWLFHYGVGVAYGTVFLLIVGAEWLMQPDFLSAWIFALVTIAAGWFILLPGMGLGLARTFETNVTRRETPGCVLLKLPHMGQDVPEHMMCWIVIDFETACRC